MSVQTTYTDNIAAAVAGQIANTEPNTLISRNVEDAAGIAFGLAVSQGTEDRECIATTTGETLVVGITVRDRSVDPATPDLFAQGDSARVMTKGTVWVTASLAVAAGDPVYVVLATGAFSNIATGAIIIPNARWDTSTSGAALAVVRLA